MAPGDAARGPRMHYHQAGDGTSRPALLLIHGLGASLRHWDAVVPQLAATRRVIAVDLPGFGSSPSDDRFSFETATDQLLELIEALDLVGCCVVGHSMGGVVALRLAHVQPAAVGKLLLLDAHLRTLFDIVRSPGRAVTHPAAAAALGGLIAGSMTPGRSRLASLSSRSAPLRALAYWPVLHHPARIDGHLLRETYADVGNRGTRDALQAIRNLNAEALTAAPGVPVHLAWGTHDRLIVDGDLERVSERLHPVSCTPIPGAGHWPMIERPSQVTAAIRSICN
jgi:pimeloyl-ACP methyl ester carboxylesterase